MRSLELSSRCECFAYWSETSFARKFPRKSFPYFSWLLKIMQTQEMRFISTIPFTSKQCMNILLNFSRMKNKEIGLWKAFENFRLRRHFITFKRASQERNKWGDVALTSVERAWFLGWSASNVTTSFNWDSAF